MASASEDLIYSLIGDIGGTNCRLQVISFTPTSSEHTDVKTKFYKTVDYQNFTDCVHEFIQEFKGTPRYPQNAVFACAGPIYNRKVTLSNMTNWVLEEQDLEKDLDMKVVSLINDFEAIGYAMIQLQPGDIETIIEAPRIEGGTMIVAGAGTGMGECILRPTKQSGSVMYEVYGTEGGHKNFCPTNQLEWDYMNFVMKETGVKDQFSYLSSERAFCGPGIPNIYFFFCKQ